MMLRRLLLLFVITISSMSARAALLAYTDEASYLADLATLGYTPVLEGFENDAVWGGVRSTISGGFNSAPLVSSQGMNWTSNNSTSEITTGSGAARSGDWGVFSYAHGSYTSPEPGTDCTVPGDCGDGLRGQAASGVLYGIGGWFRTNTPFAKLGLFIGDYPDNPVDFGETCPTGGGDCVDNAILGTAYEFFGVIDSAGFAGFEFRELEGTIDDAKYIFADDFSFAGSATVVPEPATVWLMLAGLVLLLGFGRPRSHARKSLI
jgi:hypothetical protein